MKRNAAGGLFTKPSDLALRIEIDVPDPVEQDHPSMMVATYGAGSNSQLFRGVLSPQEELPAKDRLKLRFQNGKLFLRKPIVRTCIEQRGPWRVAYGKKG